VTLRLGLYGLLGGLFTALLALPAGHFAWSWLAGMVLTASLVPVARFGPRSPLAQFGFIAVALVVVGLVCTLSEGVLFYPEIKAHWLRDFSGGTVMYLLTAAVLMALAKGLKLTATAPHAVERRPVAWAIPLVLLSGLSYVVYYLIFGLIAFQFFTKQYYPHAQEQVAALGGWFWGYQWARGTLMILAVLPIIYSLRLPRWQAALAVGVILWLGGGCAGLLVPNTMMATRQRYLHIGEIMTQNVSLGITAVLLLRKRERVRTGKESS